MVSAAIMIASFRSLAFIYYYIGYFFLFRTQPRKDILSAEIADMDKHISKNYDFPSVTDASKGIYKNCFFHFDSNFFVVNK